MAMERRGYKVVAAENNDLGATIAGESHAELNVFTYLVMDMSKKIAMLSKFVWEK